MIGKRKVHILLLNLFLICKIANATHIVGGEIYYDNLGNNNYRIYMKVYRDCINGIPGFDNPAFFTIFDQFGSVITTLQVAHTTSINVPPTNNSPCAPAASGNACVEEAIYMADVNLPPITGGYYITYQRCCRNNTILNLVDPGAVGATYWEHIPGPEVVSVNSSPRFSNRPPIYICQDLPIGFDHVATDPDGDSLVYSLCSPFNGLDGCCPIIAVPQFAPNTGSPQCYNPPSACPTVNTAPPYISVPFVPPYSASYPMASNPAININSQTGFLNGNPSIQGQWVVGVCVEEYRNGVLIGTHHRDFQFNVISCPFVIAADIVSQTTTNNGAGTGYCNGFTISYYNNSYNGSTYFWDFGDPNSTTDTSSAFNPTYTFTSPGDYTVTLIANPQSPCSDTTYEVFHVHPLLSPDFIKPDAQCFENNSFDFSGTGSFQGNGSFMWNFGPNASPQTSSALNVNNVNFSAPGIYTVSFTVNENGCTATTTKTLGVYENPKAQIGNFISSGCNPLSVTFENNSTPSAPLNYNWVFSNGETSTELSPTITYSTPGVYSATLTVTSTQDCIDTNQVTSVNSLTVFPTPTSVFTATPTIVSVFDADITFNDSSYSNIVAWNYDFGDGGNSQIQNPFYTYNNYGDYTVTETVTNTYGCVNTSTLQIKVLPEFRFWIPNAFTPGKKDLLNDIYKPVIMGVEDYNFYIFNRWGQLIYQTNDINAGWDGTFKGKESPMDVYVWKCDFKNVVSKQNEYHVGHVTLVR